MYIDVRVKNIERILEMVVANPKISWIGTKMKTLNFKNNCRGQSVALLTWVFMKDRESHYILEREKDEIPLDIQVEDSTNISVEDSSVSTRKRSPLSIEKLFHSGT